MQTIMIIITEMPPTADPSQSELHDLPRLPASSPANVIDSQVLLQGGRELRIQHGDQTYRLCHTRNDKLILVK